jgi:hypothetical protein
MTANTIETGVDPKVEQRLNCLRESHLRECARLALSKSVLFETQPDSAVALRLGNTVNTILQLTKAARSAFEKPPTNSKSKPSLALDDDQLLELLRRARERSAEDLSRDEPDEITAQILERDPFALSDKLDLDDDSDRLFDESAQAFLMNLEGVDVMHLKRYTRYNIAVGLNHPTNDLQLAITRRHITPQEDNPIEDTLAQNIDDPHGVHYSIVFEPIPKK